MNGLEFIVIGFATWRIASMIAVETGPAGVFEWFRDKVGIEYDERSIPVATNFIGEGLMCVWCNSVWIGLAFTGLWYWQKAIALILSLPFALSALAIIVEEIVGEK